MIDMETIGKRIRERRLELGMTQAELAEKIGCGQDKISLLERARKGSNIYDLNKLEQICDALSIHLKELLFYSTTEEVQPMTISSAEAREREDQKLKEVLETEGIEIPSITDEEYEWYQVLYGDDTDSKLSIEFNLSFLSDEERTIIYDMVREKMSHRDFDFLWGYNSNEEDEDFWVKIRESRQKLTDRKTEILFRDKHEYGFSPELYPLSDAEIAYFMRHDTDKDGNSAAKLSADRQKEEYYREQFEYETESQELECNANIRNSTLYKHAVEAIDRFLEYGHGCGFTVYTFSPDKSEKQSISSITHEPLKNRLKTIEELVKNNPHPKNEEYLQNLKKAVEQEESEINRLIKEEEIEDVYEYFLYYRSVLNGRLIDRIARYFYHEAFDMSNYALYDIPLATETDVIFVFSSIDETKREFLLTWEPKTKKLVPCTTVWTKGLGWDEKETETVIEAIVKSLWIDSETDEIIAWAEQQPYCPEVIDRIWLNWLRQKKQEQEKK